MPKAKKKSALKRKTAAKTKKTVRKASAKKTTAKRKKVSPIPKGYTAVTPYLIINKCSKAIEFYKKAFGAKELFRMENAGKS